MSKGSASPITLPRLRGALHPLEALPGGDGWNLDELSDLLVPDSSVAEAAVLVPLVPRESSLGVLLTRRTDALRHHPGQVSFPGGRVEDDDANVVAAAQIGRASGRERVCQSGEISGVGGSFKKKQ